MSGLDQYDLDKNDLTSQKCLQPVDKGQCNALPTPPKYVCNMYACINGLSTIHVAITAQITNSRYRLLDAPEAHI